MTRYDPTPAVCCEECGKELIVVCPKGHVNPLELRKKSKGPVAPPPRQTKNGGSRSYTPKPQLSAAEKNRQRQIGQALRDARLKAGYSPEELGSLIDRAPGSFSVWETGGARIGSVVVPKLAKVLKLNPVALVNEFHATGNGKAHG